MTDLDQDFEELRAYAEKLENYSNDKLTLLNHVFDHVSLVKYELCSVCFSKFNKSIFCNICQQDQYNLAIKYHSSHKDVVITNQTFMFINKSENIDGTKMKFMSGIIKIL